MRNSNTIPMKLNEEGIYVIDTEAYKGLCFKAEISGTIDFFTRYNELCQGIKEEGERRTSSR